MTGTRARLRRARRQSPSPGGVFRAAAALLAIIACMAADGSWLTRVPQADRQRVNPYAGQADAAAAGSRIFADRCARCHGPDALGRGKRPPLRSERVQNAKDGEIFWLLRNGNLGKGMPSWSALPEPSRWQVVTYIKCLGIAPDLGAASETAGTPGSKNENSTNAHSGPQR